MDRRGRRVVKIWVLGSGSRGNAVLVDCDGSRMLVDCGYGTRTLASRLKAIDVKPESIDGCLITHEHTDHVSGAAAAAKRWGWSLYATAGTASAAELTGKHVNLFEPGTTIDFPCMTVTSTRIPHDATEPVGFVIESRSTGARAGLFYDIGYVTRRIAKACESLDILVIESNHDEDMLRYGPYTPALKRRIASRFGHLSNPEAGRFAREMVTRDLKHVVLAHLSEENNSPEVATTSMRGAMARTRFKGTITAAQQDAVVGPFVPNATRAEKPLQYALF
jgi:phosphoribosyl 1,2-cyclic phosphodiesterase